MDKTEKIVLGVVGGAAILTAVSLVNMKVDGATPPVVTLIQSEPLYYENTEIVGFNAEKFSNPETLTRKAEAASFVQNPTTSHTPAESLPGERLTKSKGVFHGVSGKETWYNLPMGGVVQIMRNAGFSEEQYPYWEREDGCKMLGDYIIVAANLELRPRGTIVETSLGLGIVADTGGFAAKDKTAIDIAVTW